MINCGNRTWMDEKSSWLTRFICLGNVVTHDPPRWVIRCWNGICCHFKILCNISLLLLAFNWNDFTSKQISLISPKARRTTHYRWGTSVFCRKAQTTTEVLILCAFIWTRWIEFLIEDTQNTPIHLPCCLNIANGPWKEKVKLINRVGRRERKLFFLPK